MCVCIFLHSLLFEDAFTQPWEALVGFPWLQCGADLEGCAYPFCCCLTMAESSEHSHPHLSTTLALSPTACLSSQRFFMPPPLSSVPSIDVRKNCFSHCHGDQTPQMCKSLYDIVWAWPGTCTHPYLWVTYDTHLVSCQHWVSSWYMALTKKWWQKHLYSLCR